MAARKTTSKKTSKPKKAPLKTSRARKTTKPVKPVKTTKKTTSVKTSDVSSYSELDKPVKTSSNKVRYILLGIIALLVLFLFRKYMVVATVNGSPIYRTSVLKRLEMLGGQQVTEELIQQRLVDQEARARGIQITQDDISSEISQIEERLSQQGATLDDVLVSQGISREQFEESLELQIAIRKMVEGDIEVTDEEVQSYYDENKDFYEEEELTEELKGEIRNLLKETELATNASTFLQDLQAKASISRNIEY